MIYSIWRRCAFGECQILIGTVNDLIKMWLKDYLASGWSLKRERLMAENRKGGGVLHIRPFWDRGRCQAAQHREIRPRLGCCLGCCSHTWHTHRPPTNRLMHSVYENSKRLAEIARLNLTGWLHTTNWDHLLYISISSGQEIGGAWPQ